jgi:nicotinamidase/pyrazinamidase
MSRELLLVVDMQNDFMPGGTLAVPEGDAVVPLVNRLAARFPHVVLTEDWHPKGHFSFASSHPGQLPFETIAAVYGPQVLWPDHCVQGTPGAEFHRDLAIPHAELIIRKGYNAGIDSYSAFREADGRPTGLAGYLRERGVTHVVVAGLALDFCVAWSTRDAVAAGFAATVVEDACRAIDTGGSLTAARADMAAAGVKLVRSEALLGKR